MKALFHHYVTTVNPSGTLLPAVVHSKNEDGTVNLIATSPNGVETPHENVPFFQLGDATPEAGFWAIPDGEQDAEETGSPS